MRPLVRPMFVFALGGALAAVAWVLSLWVMIGTLPTEHGPAPVLPPPARIAVVDEVAEPPKVIPPPFRVQPPPASVFDPSLDSSGFGLSAGHREFGGR
jgi:hypothetical protein